MVLSVRSVVADVDSFCFQLHALGALALRRVRVILALDLHPRDCVIIEDELDGLRGDMAEALVPYIHRGSERDEITVAVVACVVPVWIQRGEAVDQVGAEGLVESKVVDAFLLLELELDSVVFHPGRVRAEVERAA